MAYLSAHILQEERGGGENLSRYQFLEMLCERLIEENSVVCETRRKGRPSCGENPLWITARHFPSTIPATKKKDNKPVRRLHVCASRKKRKETKTIGSARNYFVLHHDLEFTIQSVSFLPIWNNFA